MTAAGVSIKKKRCPATSGQNGLIPEAATHVDTIFFALRQYLPHQDEQSVVGLLVLEVLVRCTETLCTQTECWRPCVLSDDEPQALGE